MMRRFFIPYYTVIQQTKWLLTPLKWVNPVAEV